MPKSDAFNCDCLEYMKSLSDNAFDLAVVDPPYGDGLYAEDGGGKGWFTKYNQRGNCSQFVNAERERESRYNRFGNPGSRFERYKRDTDKERTFDSRTAPGDMPSGEPKRGGLTDRPEQAEPGPKSTAKKS